MVERLTPGAGTPIALSAHAHDRIADRRTDEAWLAEAWADPATRVLVLHGTRIVPVDGRILWVAPAEAPEGVRVLLGESGGVVRFAVITAGETPEGALPLRGLLGTFDEEDGAFNGGIGGPICTRFRRDTKQEIKLPGCRGVQALTVVQTGTGPVVQVEFENGYLPSIDGCVIGNRIRRTDGSLVSVQLVGSSAANLQLQSELALCSGAITKKVVPNRTFTDANMDGQPDVNPAAPFGVFFSGGNECLQRWG